MRIKCLTTFLDGAERYEADDIRSVPDDRGAYFVANGWAEDLSGDTTTGDTTLAVDSTTVTTGDSNA
jgi:hypothetical protein